MSNKLRYLAYFSYIGTNFWGAANQGPNFTTVQSTIEKALARYFDDKRERPFVITLTSRTDAGVHATKNAFHVDLPLVNGSRINPSLLKFKLNRYFSEVQKTPIRILEVLHVPDTFHARHLCCEKLYVYRVAVYDTKLPAHYRLVTELERTHFYRTKSFDYNKLVEATQLFVGKKDFSSIVGRPKKNKRPTVCTIKSFNVEKAQPLMPSIEPLSLEGLDYYHLSCRGNRFLYRMVRRMVGITLAVASDNISLDQAKSIIDNCDPSLWTGKINVPSGVGLYLVDLVFNEGSTSFKEEMQNNEASSEETAGSLEKWS